MLLVDKFIINFQSLFWTQLYDGNPYIATMATSKILEIILIMLPLALMKNILFMSSAICGRRSPRQVQQGILESELQFP